MTAEVDKDFKDLKISLVHLDPDVKNITGIREGCEPNTRDEKI